MTMRIHKWNDVKHRKMTPERIAASEKRVEEAIVEIRLRALRESEGITQEELARRMDVAQVQASRAERRDNPHIDTVRRFLEALGYNLVVVAVKKTDETKRVQISI
jgi:predicted transcriptional regulator